MRLKNPFNTVEILLQQKNRVSLMRKYFLLFVGITVLTANVAGEQKIVTLTSAEIEAIFLKQNLELIAEQMDISLADAAVSQARLWDNPTLSISDLNLWSTKSQRNGEREVIPPLFGSFGRNTEFSIELSQLIQTANKRGKLVRREKVSREMSLRQFEEVLRGLKTELRKSINEVQYLDSYHELLDKQAQSLSLLIQTYRKQVEDGNIAKSELLRLQSILLEIENEMNEVRSEWNGQQKTLKRLLNIDPSSIIRITREDNQMPDPERLVLNELLYVASDYRPDLKLHELQTSYFEKSLAYEKSLRVPDITFSASYDRYGGVWKDFIGFGLSIDLPILNRNQGNIKMARISRDQSQYMVRQYQNVVGQEIAEALSNYITTYDFYRKIEDNPLLQELDVMLEIYSKNLLNRNISMLEYLDFLDAYKSNKQTSLSVSKNVFNQLEELQFAIGIDLNKIL